MNTASQYKIGDWLIDPELRVMKNNATSHYLQPKTMKVLSFLADQQGELISRETLLEYIWGKQSVSDEPLTRCISLLRKAFGDSKEEPQYIETHHKRGYRLIQPVHLSHPKNEDDNKNPNETNAIQDLSASKEKISIAIIPFQGLPSLSSPSPENEDIAYELCAVISMIPQLNVVSWLSSKPLSGRSHKDIQQTLNVQYCLTGHIIRKQQHIDLYLELIDADSGIQVFSDQCCGPITQIPLLIIDLVFNVIEYLEIPVDAQLKESLAVHPTPPSKDLLDQGLKSLEYRSIPGFYDSLSYFEKSIHLSQDASTYAALASVHAMLPFYNPMLNAKTSHQQALIYGQKALETSQTNSQAWTSLGLVFSRQFKWNFSKDCFKKALMLDPKNSNAHHWYAQLLGFRGEFEEAIHHNEEAIKLDALSPTPIRNLSVNLMVSGQYEEAEKQIRYLLERYPNYPYSWTALTHMYIANGEAKKLYNTLPKDIYFKLLTSEQQHSLIHSINSFQQTGETQPMPNGIPELIFQKGLLGRLYASIGQYHDAIACYERAFETEDNWVHWIYVDVLNMPLRQEDRFQRLIHKIQF